jgi:Mn-dependent DtxR family transcriptional regulator
MDSNEIALLELLAIKPVSYFPPQGYMMARRLARRGLVAFKDGRWFPTDEGLRIAERVHFQRR